MTQTMRRTISSLYVGEAEDEAEAGYIDYNACMNGYDAALKHFKKVDPVLYKAAQKTLPSLSRVSEITSNTRLFSTLSESVVSQQLSVKASDTIFGRLKEICGGAVTVDAILKATFPRLRKAGLSAAKAKTLKEIAKTVRKGLVLTSLRKYSPEEATEALTKIWGVGPWTAEMFLIFGLKHPDIFSPGDLGLVRSIETLYGVKNLSKERLHNLTACWSPYRSLACRVLWRARDM